MKTKTVKAYTQFLRSTAPFRKSRQEKDKPLTEKQKKELVGYKEYFKALGREYKGGTK